jgi:Zn-dependent protease
MPNLIETLYRLSYGIPAIVLALTVHEWAHARTALALGDRTAASQGRVTLNPIAHLDPMGSVLILFTMMSGFGIGWGKPVPVNPAAFKHPLGDFFVSAAGPASNFVLATLSGLLLRLSAVSLAGLGSVGNFLVSFLLTMVILNITLGLFNLIPLNPLDGSHALGNLLPPSRAVPFKAFQRQYGMAVLGAMLVMGWFTSFSPLTFLLRWPAQQLTRLLVGF